VQVLTLKLGEFGSEQPSIALNILTMAQNFGGLEVNHRRHQTHPQRVTTTGAPQLTRL
jgi:hypothetical protein